MYNSPMYQPSELPNWLQRDTDAAARRLSNFVHLLAGGSTTELLEVLKRVYRIENNDYEHTMLLVALESLTQSSVGPRWFSPDIMYFQPKPEGERPLPTTFMPRSYLNLEYGPGPSILLAVGYGGEEADATGLNLGQQDEVMMHVFPFCRRPILTLLSDALDQRTDFMGVTAMRSSIEAFAASHAVVSKPPYFPIADPTHLGLTIQHRDNPFMFVSAMIIDLDDL